MIPVKGKNEIWSDEQWLAIHYSGTNILVNAGAGSGKTAVLTERILEILRKGIKLENLVVLTFTKAAASEMKERLRARLIKEVSNGNMDLIAELDYIDQARIQTFDSFALSIVTKYHYLLHLEKSIKIGDSIMFRLEKMRIIDEVFNIHYAKEDEKFLNFIKFFSIKNDNELTKAIFDIHNSLDLLADKINYLESYLATYYNDDFIRKNVIEYKGLIFDLIDQIKARFEMMNSKITDEALVSHVSNCYEAVQDLLFSKSFKALRENIEVKLPRIPTKVESDEEKLIVQAEKEGIKDIIKTLKDYLVYDNEEEMFKEVESSRDKVSVMIELLNEVDNKFSLFKDSINAYEFGDIVRFAIKLLKDNESVRSELSNDIHEILIDEYQDTNDLQEILIGMLSKDNVYMVGDIKQSIYRFRNANPEIFKEKYKNFNELKTGKVIDLSKNFRSRSEVLENINLVFSRIMDSDVGGVDYGDGQKLLYGNHVYDKNKANQNYNMEVLNYNLDENEVGLNKHELDAFMIVEDIKDKIKNNYQVFDKNIKILRNLELKDITILTAEKGQFDLYKKIFEASSIPLVIHKDQSFIKSNEIFVIKNILRAVLSLVDSQYYKDNFRDSVISILRSFLVEVDDKTISKVFTMNPLEGLKIYYNEVFEKLIKIKEIVPKSSLSQILWKIYEEFDLYMNIVKLANVELLEDKLNYLLVKFKDLDQVGYSLLDVVSYLDEIMAEGFDIENPIKSGNITNAVNMMSVHKSKGLEFPVCYFPELDSRFKFKEVQSKIIFDQRYGIIIPSYSDGLRDSFYKQLLKNKYVIEEVSERIRVLYVALTRAKEQFILVSPNYPDLILANSQMVTKADRLKYKSFYQILSSITDSFEDNKIIKSVKTYSNNYRFARSIDKLPTTSEKIEVRNIELTKTERISKTASTAAVGILSRDSIKNMEIGTKIHRYFELIDFKKGITNEIELINEEEFIKNKIIAFFNLDIIRKSDIIETYHELEFIQKSENIDLHGIIDLVLETKDELIIIDYKLSDISKEEYTNQLFVYKNYLESISSKKVSAYLYSIMKEQLKNVF